MPLVEVNRRPSRLQLRLFAGIGLPLFCTLLGLMLHFKGHHPLAAQWVWALGPALALAGWVWPYLVKPMWVGLNYAAWPISFALSYLLIGALYYLVITPTGLIMRALGRDLMGKTFDRDASTYWTAHDPGAKPERYFKQY